MEKTEVPVGVRQRLQTQAEVYVRNAKWFGKRTAELEHEAALTWRLEMERRWLEGLNDMTLVPKS